MKMQEYKTAIDKKDKKISQLSHKIMEKREMSGCQARRLPPSAQWMCE